MPSKSRHGRRKYSFQDKKKKGRRSSPGVVIQQQAAPQIDKPVAPPRVAAPLIRKPTQMPTPIAARYPYIFAELREIGILAGIMLVILVVLALVLS